MATSKFKTTYVTHFSCKALDKMNRIPFLGKPLSFLVSEQTGLEACHQQGTVLTKQQCGELRAGPESRDLMVIGSA